MPETDSQQEAGFEFDGRFYPWKLSDTGKDLLLIDRISNMAVDQFFYLVEDDEVVLRGSVLLTMIATSLRAGNPNWSIERVYRTVMDLSLGEDIEMIGGDEVEDEEGKDSPPVEEDSAEQEPEQTSSTSPADESS